MSKNNNLHKVGINLNEAEDLLARATYRKFVLAVLKLKGYTLHKDFAEGLGLSTSRLSQHISGFKPINGLGKLDVVKMTNKLSFVKELTDEEINNQPEVITNEAPISELKNQLEVEREKHRLEIELLKQEMSGGMSPDDEYYRDVGKGMKDVSLFKFGALEKFKNGNITKGDYEEAKSKLDPFIHDILKQIKDYEDGKANN